RSARIRLWIDLDLPGFTWIYLDLLGPNDRPLRAAQLAVQPTCHQLGFQRIESFAAGALQAVASAGNRQQRKLHLTPAARATDRRILLSHAFSMRPADASVHSKG